MSKSKIEWTDTTWNPVTGCTKVSPGCKNCYAETIAKRFWGERKFTDVQLHPDRLEQPLHWREPRMVFVNSMSDLFHEDVPFEFIQQVFYVMHQAKQHTFQILTKRPERMLQFLTEYLDAWSRIQPPNVWLGVSCENQKTADERISLLLQIPAAVRCVSAEPLLGKINLQQISSKHEEDNVLYFPLAGEFTCEGRNEPLPLKNGGLDWVIVGGESGQGARPCNVNWIRDIVKQCKECDVPVFVKQLGTCPTIVNTFPPRKYHPMTGKLNSPKGGDPSEWPEDLRVREWPKNNKER